MGNLLYPSGYGNGLKMKSCRNKKVPSYDLYD